MAGDSHVPILLMAMRTIPGQDGFIGSHSLVAVGNAIGSGR